MIQQALSKYDFMGREVERVGRGVKGEVQGQNEEVQRTTNHHTLIDFQKLQI
jgi:hypothetical protein